MKIVFIKQVFYSEWLDCFIRKYLPALKGQREIEFFSDAIFISVFPLTFLDVSVFYQWIDFSAGNKLEKRASVVKISTPSGRAEIVWSFVTFVAGVEPHRAIFSLFTKRHRMKGQSLCLEESMKKMFLEKRVDELYSCIWARCYPNSRRSVLRSGGREQDAEDTFSEAVYILLYEKLPDKTFQLFGSVCGFLGAVTRNLWLKKRDAQNRMPTATLDTLDFWYEEDEFSLLANLFPEATHAIRSCLEQMGKNCELEKIKPSPCQAPDAGLFPELNKTPMCIVLYMKYYRDAHDKEVAPLVGYTNIRGVAELRRRCRNDLKECLRKYHPGLFDF